MNRSKFTYIQFPLFILRNAHDDFDLMIEYIIAFGVYQKSFELCGYDFNLMDMRMGLEYLKISPQINNETLTKWEEMALTIIEEYESTATIKGKQYPMPNVKVQLLQTLSKEKPNKKKIDEFLGYVAVQSIIGKRKCFKTNNKHVLARMMGFASFSDVEQYGIDNLKPHTLELYNRYLIRGRPDISKARMKTLFNRLMNSWRVIKVSESTRGYYIAMQDKITASELGVIVANNKKSNKAKQIQNEFKEALKKAG